MQVVTCDTTEQGEQDSVDQAQACDAGDQPDEHREMHKRQETAEQQRHGAGGCDCQDGFEDPLPPCELDAGHGEKAMEIEEGGEDIAQHHDKQESFHPADRHEEKDQDNADGGIGHAVF